MRVRLLMSVAAVAAVVATSAFGVSGSGTITTVAGTKNIGGAGGWGFSGDGSPATSAHLADPGVAVDGRATPNEAIPFGVWQQIAVSIRNNADGSVTIGFARGGSPAAEATDSGLGCPPIRQNGAVGVRGDNDNFSVENFTVRSGPSAASA